MTDTVQVASLDHVNLRAARPMFDRLRAFYRDVLGLREGPRPAFGNEGAWLYAGERAVVHLTLPPDGGPEPAPHLAVVDHFAFSARDPAAAARVLAGHGIEVRETKSATTRQHQFFFLDPAGNGVELNFPYVD